MGVSVTTSVISKSHDVQATGGGTTDKGYTFALLQDSVDNIGRLELTTEKYTVGSTITLTEV